MNASASPPSTDIEIARAATLAPIEAIAAKLGIPAEAVYRYGPYKAKLSARFQPRRRGSVRAAS